MYVPRFFSRCSLAPKAPNATCTKAGYNLLHGTAHVEGAHPFLFEEPPLLLWSQNHLEIGILTDFITKITEIWLWYWVPKNDRTTMIYPQISRSTQWQALGCWCVLYPFTPGFLVDKNQVLLDSPGGGTRDWWRSNWLKTSNPLIKRDKGKDGT